MPRPKNNRIIYEPPLFTEFKPAGIPGKSLHQSMLSLDEFEALRLADFIGMSHEEICKVAEFEKNLNNGFTICICS